MAIYRLSATPISRGKGQSAVAAAAYRSGTSLKDERSGEIKDYSARSHAVLFSGIFAPKDAPTWASDREQLWNHVEAVEQRKDARLAREFQIALPHEMTDQQRQWLVQDFVREQFTRHGLVADVAIHAPDWRGDERNHHAHVMVAERTIDADGFAATKDRNFNSKEQMAVWREGWANLANRHLARHGIEASIDHRSHAERGLDAEPTKYEGPTVTQLFRQGIVTDRRQENDEIRLRNDARAQLRADIPLSPDQITITPQPDAATANAASWAQALEMLEGMDKARLAAQAPQIDPRNQLQADRAAVAAAPSPGRDEEERRPTVAADNGLGWTSGGGMVAQQASAAIWAKDANRAPTPAPASADTRTAKEIEHDEYLAAFRSTLAKSMDEREQGNDNEQDGGRDLDR